MEGPPTSYMRNTSSLKAMEPAVGNFYPLVSDDIIRA